MTTHFRNMEHRYGAPIVIWNLIKTNESREHRREGIVGEDFAEACSFYNDSLPQERQLRYMAIDFKQVAKEHKGGPLDYFTNEAHRLIADMGLFFATSLKGDRTQFQPLRLQLGILRTNCIDCLDRTNVAMFAAGRAALELQLEMLLLASRNSVDRHSPVFQILMDQWEIMGDYLAQQYGGSGAHAGAFHKARGEGGITRSGVKLMTDIRRYYSNTFTDADKQNAMNLFMGVFKPSREQPHLWDAENDQNLHNEAEGTADDVDGFDSPSVRSMVEIESVLSPFIDPLERSLASLGPSHEENEAGLSLYDLALPMAAPQDGEVLTREELYDLHYKPHKLTVFEKHFAHTFNQPQAVRLTDPQKAPLPLPRKTTDPDPEEYLKQQTALTRMENLCGRYDELKVYSHYIMGEEQLKSGQVDISDLDPNTRERKQVEFSAYIAREPFKRKGRMDNPPDDKKPKQEQIYAEALEAVQPDAAQSAKMQEMYERMPEIALWHTRGGSQIPVNSGC